MKLYTSKVVAKWLGLTERRVRQLRDEKVIEEIQPGLYDLQASVLAYIKYIGGTGKEDLVIERTKLMAEKRKAAEMDNEMRSGNIHKTEDIELGIKTMCLNMRGRFLSIPAKLAPAVVALHGDQGAVFDAIKKAIEETLEDVSNYQIAFAEPEEDDEEEKAN